MKNVSDSLVERKCRVSSHTGKEKLDDTFHNTAESLHRIGVAGVFGCGLRIRRRWGTFTTFIDPQPPSIFGPPETFAEGINNAGEIVGYGFPSVTSAFLFAGGNFTAINDPLGGLGTIPHGINDAGEIVGQYNAGGQGQAYVDVGGSFTTFDDSLEGGLFASTQAAGINDAGQIVGVYHNDTGGHGFLDSGGTFMSIDDPLATGDTSATGINDAGQIVGSYIDATGTHGFLDSDGTFTAIDGPFASSTWANGINDSGEITGFIQTPEPSTLAMAFAALLGMAGLLKWKLLTSSPGASRGGDCV